MKRFRKIGDTYAAIHYKEKKVYLVEDTGTELAVRIWTGQKAVDQLDRHLGKDIDERLFCEKFSNAVAKLASDTPYA